MISLLLLSTLSISQPAPPDSAAPAPTFVETAPTSLARGRTLASSGDWAGAKVAFARAIELAKVTGDDRLTGEAAEAAGTLMSTNAAGEAKVMFEVALARYKDIGDLDGMIAIHRKMEPLGDAGAHQAAISRLQRGELQEAPEIAAAPAWVADVSSTTPDNNVINTPDPGDEDDDDDDDASDDGEDRAWLVTLLGIAAVGASSLALGIAVFGAGGDRVRVGVEFPPER